MRRVEKNGIRYWERDDEAELRSLVSSERREAIVELVDKALERLAVTDDSRVGAESLVPGRDDLAGNLSPDASVVREVAHQEGA